ncbi:glycoside hydrolase family 65 protein [Fervidibacillus halotolerans]|uniref:Family 65 glycosyl hydrolase n=1 Tax=Fervidibacillus halotolerans TaxID=2980027 RepID=A0A9E8RWY3_9BACI|nr:glycosyl hydrolase family 65 protein [Fervidibacillus halotolerans]WAA12225.1 family 65 glycosyl hydrolase [Fervidibacillus halotolerans]
MTWQIRSRSLKPEDLLVEESLFSLANGYLGVRGNLEEGLSNYESIKGTYLNAFHDVVEIPYGEKLYGFPDTQQKMVNVIDAQSIQFFFGEDEEPYSPLQGDVIHYERILHMDKGYSERMIQWRSPKGKEVKIRFIRLVSFQKRELFSIFVEIIPVNFFGKVKVVSSVNGDVSNYVNSNDPRVGSGHAKLLNTKVCERLGDYLTVVNETKKTKFQVACVTSHRWEEGQQSIETNGNELTVTNVFQLSKPTVFEKRNVYVDTLRHGDELIEKGISLQERWKQMSMEELLTEQRKYVTQFWDHADVKIYGDEKVQEGIRFNLYHLLQSAGRDSYSNIAAKGLSGEGYEGHYFWDTEIYMVPVFLMTKPELAKQLLLYRYSILDAARKHAKIMGHQKGALFPWRTISGSECSSYFPSGSAQYHISADIAYSFVQYYLATGDEAFFETYGAELLFETARIWIETGHFAEDGFRIDAVTGPDEYTCIVNNNYYTNVMAKYNLEWATKLYDRLDAKGDKYFHTLKTKLNLKKEERDLWEKAAKEMYLPYDEKLKINPQDDTFLQKAKWDFSRTPKENYPLLLHYHPLTIYRYQVCKQADTVLAHFLLEDEQSMETIRHSYHYYEKITTHDSSLSSCIYSIMAAKIGEMDKAYHYFTETARLDLDNTHKNTKDGLHLANMGGTWMAIVFGFAGMRIKESGLHFHPRLPKRWSGYECNMQFRSRYIKVKVFKERTEISIKGNPLELTVSERKYLVKEGEPLVIPTNE